MNLLENILLLIGLPLGVILAGYWLAVRLTAIAASERLAVASIAGLATLLWNVAAVNFFRPLGDAWAWLCVWPVVVALVLPTVRRAFVQDFVSVATTRRGLAGGLFGAMFLVTLLWPLLTRPELVFYDGTSNHDAFFWISAAEHLKRHTYMELPGFTPTHPLTGAIGAIIGWHPAWGRMGGEGLLAFTSSIVHLAPVKLYLCASAALFVTWVAGIFLTLRTFLVGRLGFFGTAALVLLQPVFVFFHGNANLPNLLGALMAGGAVVATERSLHPAPRRGAWLLLVALSFHGLLCSYPEMIPFVVMPAGLLWLRVWFARGFKSAWRPAGAVALAWIGGIALNPVSAIRAWPGFITSFNTARANQNWANLFEPLTPFEYVPGLATLSVGTCHKLGFIVGAALTVALLAGLVLAVRRATDRLGGLFTLAGAGALLAYTLYTGFNYGWQKTVQFGGVFWAAFLPVAIVDAYTLLRPANARLRLLARGAALAVLALFAAATLFNCLDGHKWSRRKILTQDWFSLRDFSREQLREIPVLVDGSSFRMAFFHGMWATYFLPENPLYFAARGEENGGYLRGGVLNEARDPLPPIGGYLVSRDWADTFDANSPQWFLGDTVALLKRANRVKSWQGLYPDNGPPDAAGRHIVIELTPHSASELLFELLARHSTEWPDAHWTVVAQVAGSAAFTTEISGRPPWHFTVPLTPGQLNRIEFTLASSVKSAEPFPFGVRHLKVRSVP